MKTKLIKFHFIILLILVVNFVITSIFDIGLNSYVKTLLALLLYGSGFSLFALNFKRLFKPFTLLKFYSTFFVTIPLLVLFVSNIDEHWSNSISSDFRKSISIYTPVYRQYNYEIYEKTHVLDILNTNCFGTTSSDYHIDKNYFIFSIRLGYFDFDYNYKDREVLNIDDFKPLKSKSLKNINVEKDSVYMNFNNHVRAFEIEE